ncbi:MAG TPA: methylenetetrahydrofolate reductase [Gaiellaceae bacterium]|jgi:methylenetetrahydrofolate reductase (NADPH)|nr:methylenetetrahydrofolate reductase [Gaiellaceae bacterium]
MGVAAAGAVTVAELLRRPRYEVLPLDGVEEAVLEHVPPEVTLTVTVSPSRGIEHSLDCVERLTGHGYDTVPHLSARLVRDRGHLAELVARLESLGRRDVFVVAGDAREPAGQFEGAAPLLEAMAELGHPFTDVGITGYPESHPLIDDETTISAMFAKARYATYIVSQICFDPSVTVAWVNEVWRRGTRLPIWLGIPGLVPRTKLIRVSTKIGLGESARFLRHHGTWVTRLLRPQGFSPDPLLRGLAPALAEPERRIAGFHVFTLNDVADTERWRRQRLA